jgi:hypothetical protein
MTSQRRLHSSPDCYAYYVTFFTADPVALALSQQPSSSCPALTARVGDSLPMR